MSERYRVEFGPAAARAHAKLTTATRNRVRSSLERLAGDVAEPDRVRGNRVKTIKGVSESFYRLRVGDHRVMFDVIDEDRVVLVLGIVHRGDLERWLRSR